ncbi:phosphotriesterase [Chloroflexota bacterium]
MKSSELKGKVQTILGLIDPKDLGITMTHEHLLCDVTAWLKTSFVKFEDEFEEKMIKHPVTMDILWWLRYHPFQNWDDCQLLDEKTAVDELLVYKHLGGNSIVDATIRGISPDPAALTRISRATGVNVILGTGYYVEPSYPPDIDMNARSEEEIAEEFVADIVEGIDNSGVHAGIIGELGCTWPLTDNEKKVLRAGALAQKRTNAAITIHPGRDERAPVEIIEILDRAGADLSRTIMCHIDRSVRESSTRLEIAKSGCYLEYDIFGREGYYPPKFQKVDIPNDARRVDELKELADRGYQDKLLLSQDVCNKTALCHYGGWGYGHVLREVVPVMKTKGFSQKLIDMMLIENPRRLLAFPA